MPRQRVLEQVEADLRRVDGALGTVEAELAGVEEALFVDTAILGRRPTWADDRVDRLGHRRLALMAEMKRLLRRQTWCENRLAR
jgi:hypothetical protein